MVETQDHPRYFHNTATLTPFDTNPGSQEALASPRIPHAHPCRCNSTMHKAAFYPTTRGWAASSFGIPDTYNSSTKIRIRAICQINFTLWWSRYQPSIAHFALLRLVEKKCIMDKILSPSPSINQPWYWPFGKPKYSQIRHRSRGAINIEEVELDRLAS